MSMSTDVIAFLGRNEDEWQKMLSVYNACFNAGVAFPKEVNAFFSEVLDEGYDPNDSPGKVIEIKNAVTEFSSEMQSGFDIDITKLPKGVKIVRVYNSY